MLKNSILDNILGIFIYSRECRTTDQACDCECIFIIIKIFKPKTTLKSILMVVILVAHTDRRVLEYLFLSFNFFSRSYIFRSLL